MIQPSDSQGCGINLTDGVIIVILSRGPNCDLVLLAKSANGLDCG